jgi:hypothetical protein
VRSVATRIGIVTLQNMTEPLPDVFAICRVGDRPFAIAPSDHTLTGYSLNVHERAVGHELDVARRGPGHLNILVGQDRKPALADHDSDRSLAGLIALRAQLERRVVG